MSTPETKLIDKVRASYPRVRSFKVTVTEFCMDDHPPSSGKWTYSGDEREGRDIFSSLKHDRTTMMTASFGLLTPVMKAAAQKLTQTKGRLPAYSNDRGFVISRSYDCEIVYDEEKEPNQPVETTPVSAPH